MLSPPTGSAGPARSFHARIASLLVPLGLLLYGDSLTASPAAPMERVLVLENFESGVPWQLDYRHGEGISGYLSVEDLEPTLESGESHYLTLLFHTDGETGYRIEPPAAIRIRKYLRAIAVTVYGFGEGGTLFADLLDPDGHLHRIPLGKLDFSGWRRLSATVGGRIAQRPPMIRLEGEGLLFRGLYYAPGGKGKSGVRRFYIDSIQATVRAHFRLPAIQWE